MGWTEAADLIVKGMEEAITAALATLSTDKPVAEQISEQSCGAGAQEYQTQGKTDGGMQIFPAGTGIQFKSLTDAITTGTPAGRFFFHVMTRLAGMERELIIDRVRYSTVGYRHRSCINS